MALPTRMIHGIVNASLAPIVRFHWQDNVLPVAMNSLIALIASVNCSQNDALLALSQSQVRSINSDDLSSKSLTNRFLFPGIGGTRFISFEDRHWHNDCFICGICKSSLVGRGFISDEEEDIICPDCAKAKLMAS